jgi:hypothetical protein
VTQEGPFLINYKIVLLKTVVGANSITVMV